MLEAPEKTYASRGKGLRGPQAAAAAAAPRRVANAPSLRRDLSDDFARSEEEEIFRRTRDRRLGGLRFRVRAMPESMAGRIVAGVSVLALLGGAVASLWGARTILLEDPRLIIPSSSAIQITGNNHLTRAQLLSVFGEDVDRNLLTVPLVDRRRQLEQLPWVEHATVMRLLPNRIRVAITERTPVAFVRQGPQIGLVDANGVLLDMVSDAEAPVPTHYSFPVVTGINATEPASTRTARMKLYQQFVHELDAGKENVSAKLSEVDISSPEDVKALIPSGSSDILVHFGNEDFLARYKRFVERLPEWKQQYPKLASADMRYERQVVLEMAPGAAVPTPADAAAAAAAGKDQAKAQKLLGIKSKPAPKAATVKAAPRKPVTPKLVSPKVVTPKFVAKKPAPAPSAIVPASHGAPLPNAAAEVKPAAAKSADAKPGVHLQKSFDVPAGAHPHPAQVAPR